MPNPNELEEAQAVRRIVRFLLERRKHDGFACYMTLLSPLLPERGAGAPRLSLNMLCRSRPDLFLVTNVGDSCVVRLRDPTSIVGGAFEVTGTSITTPSRAPASLTIHKDDYDALELQLIAHLYGLPDRKTTLPSLGEYCKTHLGVEMKHRLVKFLDKRPGAFARDRDGRQLVWLVLEAETQVEGYVRERFGDEGWEGLRESLGGGGGGGTGEVRIPDSLGPEFWSSEDFPTL